MERQDRIPFPYEFEELKPEEKAEVARLFNTPFTDYVNVGPKGYKVMRSYIAEAENIYNMPVRPDDIFVVTYQRSGTTVTQELVWLLANDLDYTRAAAESITHRYPFVDLFMHFSKQNIQNFVKGIKGLKSNTRTVEVLERQANPITEELSKTSSPRFIKSHLPLCLLPPTLLDTTKVVYVARDPRDVALSSYHLGILLKSIGFMGTFKEFWNLFVNNLMTLTPFFEHIKEAWEKRDHPNMLFLFYEEISKDLPGTVRRVADFLGKKPSPDELDRLYHHLQLENFKKNPSVNYEFWRDLGLLSSGETFIRKGRVGGWRDYFDEEMTQQAERWIADNLRDTDLRFPHLDK